MEWQKDNSSIDTMVARGFFEEVFDFTDVHPLKCSRTTQGRGLLNEVTNMNVREGNRK